MIWWLSFCDGDRPEGDRFLGVAIVRAPDMNQAVQEAWRLDVNPGGEVAAVGFSEEQARLHFPPDWTNRLISKDELLAAGYAVGHQP
jgi:hypothetical protein